MKAYELIADEAHWTTGVFARDVNGNDCYLSSLEACSWCAEGAIQKCYPTTAFAMQTKACSGITNTMCLHEFNDTQGHAAVVALLKELDI